MIQIRKQFRDLDSGIADISSLLKMLVIKCDENDKGFIRIRNALNHGKLEDAER